MAKPDTAASRPPSLPGLPLPPGAGRKRPPPIAPSLSLDLTKEAFGEEVQSFCMATPKGLDVTSRHFIGTPTAGSIMTAFLGMDDAAADDEDGGADCPPLDFEEAMRRLESQTACADCEDAKADSSGRSTQCTSDCDDPALQSDCSSSECSDDLEDREECYESDFETDTESEEEDEEEEVATATGAVPSAAIAARAPHNEVGRNCVGDAGIVAHKRSHSLRRLDVGEGHSRRGHSRQRASSTAGLRSKEERGSRARSRGARARASSHTRITRQDSMCEAR